ncbi:hypothetical protein D9611_012895 [Ephemerocybe angulata]|uniref:Uncharacterized protein n=1 Tax=Ephemerocybe angulata TaxID=980116 RepID=A0A8H5BB07_9AGAR|nr:hypothetical protein D9611_012895 [Tulosesus angulatus]
MPEYREVTAHYNHITTFLSVLTATGSTNVVRIWVDPSLKNAEKDLSPNKCIISLDAASEITRGSLGSQEPVYPTCLPPGTDLTALSFKAVSMTPRAVRLDFTVVQFQLAFLTHTSVQIFAPHLWNIVERTPHTRRNYRVGIAFEFQSHTMAFVSLDNLFQPHWRLTTPEFPVASADVYHDFPRFLSDVALWLEQRAHLAKRNLATEIIRGDGGKYQFPGEKQKRSVFGGIGKYTVLELSFIAGLSPFLTEGDVFTDASRTARFILAFWCFARRSQEEIMSLIRPCIIDGALAPTNKQRERYPKSWLYVYAKDRMRVPPRMVSLLDNYELCLRESPAGCRMWDWYEPVYMKGAWDYLKSEAPDPLTVDLISGLGRLIFGQKKWCSFGIGNAAPASGRIDPITEFFTRRDLFPSQSPNLKLSHYDTLLPKEIHHFWKFRTVSCWHSPVKTISDYWSIVPAFPVGFSKPYFGERRSYADFTEVVGQEYAHQLFKYIIYHTELVAIGPLEYRGNATSIVTIHGEKLVSPVEGDRAKILCDLQINLKLAAAAHRPSTSSEPSDPSSSSSPAPTTPPAHCTSLPPSDFITPPTSPSSLVHSHPSLLSSPSPSTPSRTSLKSLLKSPKRKAREEVQVPSRPRKRGPYMTSNREMLSASSNLEKENMDDLGGARRSRSSLLFPPGFFAREKRKYVRKSHVRT